MKQKIILITGVGFTRPIIGVTVVITTQKRKEDACVFFGKKERHMGRGCMYSGETPEASGDRHSHSDNSSTQNYAFSLFRALFYNFHSDDTTIRHGESS